MCFTAHAQTPQGDNPQLTGGSELDTFRINGYGVLWLVPFTSDGSPLPQQDAFRFRFARLATHFQATEALAFGVQLGLENPSAMVLDVKLNWAPQPYLNITAGQFVIPFGNAINQSPSRFVFLDRPIFVQRMGKSAFRDLGVMLHTQKKGVLDGFLKYAVAVFNGNGRLPFAQVEPNWDGTSLLYIGRLVVDPGVYLFGSNTPNTLSLSANYAYTQDPALDSGDLDADRRASAHHLGTHLVPFQLERIVHLVGVDLEFRYAGLRLIAEWMWLQGTSKDNSVSKTSTGFNIDVSWFYEPWGLEPAARFELLDPSLAGTEDDTTLGTTFGLNFRYAPAVVSLFGGVWFHPEPVSGERVETYRVESRLQIGF